LIDNTCFDQQAKECPLSLPPILPLPLVTEVPALGFLFFSAALRLCVSALFSGTR